MISKHTKILTSALIATAVAGGSWAVTTHESDAATQTTDDAYVQADFSTVAPRVSGTITQILVDENEPVRKGQLLAIMDDREYRVAVARASADLSAANARLKSAEAILRKQATSIEEAAATVDADDAAIGLSRAKSKRYGELSLDGSASLQEREEAEATLKVDIASRRRDASRHGGERARLPVLGAEVDAARADVARASAALAAAELDLSYTRIYAPIDGTIGRRVLRIGNFVQIGTPLLSVVPLRQAYVQARFRETQLKHIRPGQKVSIVFDTLPGIKIDGRVTSIAPATGVSFAAVAPENATGNFTKIAQRLAVRIDLDARSPQVHRLRVGMSATPTIVTGS